MMYQRSRRWIFHTGALALLHGCGSSSTPNRTPDGGSGAVSPFIPLDAANPSIACKPFLPSTASEACPVTPRGGVQCLPRYAIAGPECNGRTTCTHAPVGDQLCFPICTDETGNC